MKAPRFCAGDDDACGRCSLLEDVVVDLLAASEFRVKTLAQWGGSDDVLRRSLSLGGVV